MGLHNKSQARWDILLFYYSYFVSSPGMYRPKYLLLSGEKMVGVEKSSPFLMALLASVTLLEMVLRKVPAALLKDFVETQTNTASVRHVLTTLRLWRCRFWRHLPRKVLQLQR